MKRVVIEVPDYVDSSLIFYRDGDRFRYVNPKVVDEFPIQLNVRLSDEDMEELRKRIKEFASEPVSPLAPMAPPSREEFEALRSRVEKLEQESERQCARVIKMEEGISDDLK